MLGVAVAQADLSHPDTALQARTIIPLLLKREELQLRDSKELTALAGPWPN